MHLTRRYRTSSLILSSTPNRTLRLLCCCALLAAFRHILVELTEPLASRPLRRRDPNVLPLLPRVEPTIQGVARKLELVVHQLLQCFFDAPSRSTCPVWVVFSVAYLTVALCSLAAHTFPLVEILDWRERSQPISDKWLSHQGRSLEFFAAVERYIFQPRGTFQQPTPCRTTAIMVNTTLYAPQRE